MIQQTIEQHYESMLEEYQQDVRVRLALYRGDWSTAETYVMRMIDNITDPLSPAREFLRQHWRRLNLVDLVVRSLAQVYAVKPKRSLIDVEDEDTQQQFSDFLDSMKWHKTFREAERLMHLLNSVVIHVVGNPDGTIRLDLVPLSEVYVRQHPDYPNRIDKALGVAIELTPQIDHYSVRERRAMRRFLRYEQTDNGRWKADITDIYGNVIQAVGDDIPVLPMVKIDRYETTDFYLTGNDDLITEPLEIAFQLTDLFYSKVFSAHPQAVSKGLREDEAQALRVGAGTLINLPDPSADFSFVSPSVDWVRLLESIEREVKLWLATRGIPPTEFETQRVDISGVARFQARQLLYERRNDYIPTFEQAERQLWNVVREYSYWYWTRFKVDEQDYHADWRDYDIQITFSAPKPLLTAKEIAEVWEKLINAGIKTVKDYYIEVEGMSPEQAEEKATQMQQSRRATLVSLIQQGQK